ncbi:MAG: hypothetical protein BWX87_02125 [Bacteroidetes bacterium ADurb.Bin123]|nr:MAG: hypothetical protein BWX87_02125 [Bacteroidetes bacterium ADurb.Bin123]
MGGTESVRCSGNQYNEKMVEKQEIRSRKCRFYIFSSPIPFRKIKARAMGARNLMMKI